MKIIRFVASNWPRSSKKETKVKIYVRRGVWFIVTVWLDSKCIYVRLASSGVWGKTKSNPKFIIPINEQNKKKTHTPHELEQTEQRNKTKIQLALIATNCRFKKIDT